MGGSYATPDKLASAIEKALAAEGNEDLIPGRGLRDWVAQAWVGPVECTELDGWVWDWKETVRQSG
jgi:hypothetical protein